MKTSHLGLLPLAAMLFAPVAAHAMPVSTLTGERPLVISHRGASGYLPEESVQSYQLAMRMGADYIEGDVYLTADNKAVMLHDGTLNATTNVVAFAATHPEIAALRSSNGTYDVRKFTLAQLEQLSVTCRNANGYCTDKTYFNPAISYSFTSYDAFLDLAYNYFVETGVAIGVFPEAKQAGLEVAEAILAGLTNAKYDGGPRPDAVLQRSAGGIPERQLVHSGQLSGRLPQYGGRGGCGRRHRRRDRPFGGPAQRSLRAGRARRRDDGHAVHVPEQPGQL
jgi:glycerophosphoryl diester phosphodiesterase